MLEVGPVTQLALEGPASPHQATTLPSHLPNKGLAAGRSSDGRLGRTVLSLRRRLLRVDGAGWSRKAGEHRKGNHDRDDGLHGNFHKIVGNTIVAGQRDIARCDGPRCNVRDTSRKSPVRGLVVRGFGRGFANQDARRWKVAAAGALGSCRAMSAATAILLQTSARIAIHLLVHASDVECAGRGRNADENRQGNQGG